MRSLLTLSMLLISALMHAQEKILLVGTYTGNGSKGIYAYSFNEGNGSLKELSFVEVENPSYLAISPDQKYVYAVIENGDGKGAVAAFKFDAQTGRLQQLNSQPSHGDAPCYISVDKTSKWVTIANYTGGNFCVYPINSDGSLGEAVQNIEHSGSSVNKDRQEKAHAHAAVFSPDEKQLAVVDLGIDKIMVYPFDANQQPPVTEKAQAVESTPGSGPRHVVFHQSSPVAYVLEELSGYVTAYKTGGEKWEVLQRINGHPAGFSGTIGSAAIKLSDDGKCLYASNRGSSNTIAFFSVGNTGKLTLQGHSDTGGDSPRDFTISPSGKFLLSTNSKSGSVAVFKRDPRSGKLSAEPVQVPMPSPVCLVFVK